MKTVNLIKTRSNLAEMFHGVGAEIGVERGVFSKVICQKGKIDKLYLIDCWKAYSGYRDHVSQKKLDGFYKITKKQVKDYGFCELIRKFSLEAVEDFEDNSLDFVYIDANHDYKHVYEDLTAWIKKVKKGGIVSGHDYVKRKGQDKYYAVVQALNDFVKANNIPEITIFRGDSSPSWMFIKRDSFGTKSTNKESQKDIKKLIQSFSSEKKGTKKIDTQKFIIDKFKINFNDKTKMPIEIPNFGRDNLSSLFKELGFKTGVEVGVERGIFSESLCKNNPEVKLFCVDPWEAYPGYRQNKSQQEVDEYYREAKKRLSKYNCRLINKFSLEALKDFEDRSLDFVYIDGNHNFENVTRDIVEWSRKVRYDGILAGHDYVKHRKPTGMHVVQVVNGYTDAYGIRPWYVLGTKARVKGQIRDKERSFMWVIEPLKTPERNQQ